MSFSKRGRDDDDANSLPDNKKPHHLWSLTPKNIQFPKDMYRLPRIGGRTVPVDLYVVAEEDTEDDSAFTAFCWSKMRTAQTAYHVGSLYVSLISAVSPELSRSLLPTLTDYGAITTAKLFPSEADQLGFEYNEKDAYSKVENVLLAGISLMLPFKTNVTVNERSYASFAKESLKSIGGSLGIEASRLATMTYPLDLRRAEMVRAVFTVAKREILRCLMSASSEGSDQDVRGMAREVCSMLAWNEMSLIVLIRDVLVKAKSPVLRNMGIQNEVHMFAEALRLIKGSPYPQFFRYFCTGPEEQMIQRNNFRILGAVAQEVSKRLKAGNMGGFEGKSENGGRFVNELVEMHMNWLSTAFCSRRQSDQRLDDWISRVS